MSWQQLGAVALPQGRQRQVAKESIGHGTASQCPPSAETIDDVNSTMQTNREQCNLTSWLEEEWLNRQVTKTGFFKN
jgi:hypothetical protein